jgi:hypothetical protein
MLSVIVLSVIMLNVTNKPFVLSVIMPSVVRLNVIMLSSIMLSVIMLNVTYKPFVVSVIMPSVVKLNDIMLSVVAPNKQYVIYLLHAAMQCFQNPLAYFATAVSYMHKFFMKLTPGLSFIKHFVLHC